MASEAREGEGEDGWRRKREKERKEQISKVDTQVVDITIYFQDASDLTPYLTKTKHSKCNANLMMMMMM